MFRKHNDTLETCIYRELMAEQTPPVTGDGQGDSTGDSSGSGTGSSGGN